MAIPVLYWMLECKKCGRRRIVHDCYLVFVGTSDPDPVPGAGYSGPPLPERYDCANGCLQGMRVIGSISAPTDRMMWLQEPYELVAMDQQQVNEWLHLMKEAGLDAPEVGTIPSVLMVVECERQLTEQELARQTAEVPDQVHLAPHQRGTTGYRFRLFVSVGPNSKEAGGFVVRADTPEAAQKYAALLGEWFRADLETELREIDKRNAGT